MLGFGLVLDLGSMSRPRSRSTVSRNGLYPSAGLDQLGPAHYRDEWVSIKPEQSKAASRRHTIKERSNKSTSSRHVKVTLPKLKCLGD